MYFKASGRTNPKTNSHEGYYRLVESYRNSAGRVCHRTILNVGFLSDVLTPEQLNKIARILTDIYEKKQSIFDEQDPIVQKWVTKLWSRIVEEKRLDLTLYSQDSRMISADTIKHSNVREVGAEWMCYNTWHELGIDEILKQNDFSELEIQLAQTQVISRAVYPASELATSKWIKENSAICELTGFPESKMNKDRLYRGALKLHSIKEALEQHLSLKTNELFDIQDRIMLYDLTNTYFEGEKRNSKLAQFGRSKEKRSDAKLVVLALVVNIYGFIKYSSIHAGNFSDTADLETVIDNLDYATNTKKPVVVIDAGIATKANLELIKTKGYNYLCVCRTKRKDYELDSDRLTVMLETKSKYNIMLKKVKQQEDEDYYLEITSDKKALKEQGMKTQFEKRFNVPIVETMGLTETAAQMLSNPLPPGTRKIGSPGIPIGNETAILSKDLQIVTDGSEGEIAVRGPNVMLEYLRNPTATAETFTPDGWLRTGDLGRQDQDGYFFVTGRLKELIIKGGENIAPREIDDALYTHPDVVEAAAFACPCDSYGERIEAAVKLRDNSKATSDDLLAICSTRLGKFKSPDTIHFMDELPKGPSGKIQRLKLAELTG